MAAKSGGGRPAKYLTTDGTRVPGATTVLGKCKDPGGLMHWAWKLGTEGKDYREERDAAAGIGHVVHGWIDADIRGTEREPHDLSDDDLARATEAWGAYERWRDAYAPEIVETETPLVSDEHRFGGTFDALAKLAGRVVILDWKTSNAVYGDYLAQMGAYRLLLRECRGIEITEVDLLRVSKDDGSFHHHSWTGDILARAEEAFLHALGWYRLQQQLAKATK